MYSLPYAFLMWGLVLNRVCGGSDFCSFHSQDGDLLDRFSIDVHPPIEHLGVDIGWSSLSYNSSRDRLEERDDEATLSRTRKVSWSWPGFLSPAGRPLLWVYFRCMS